METNQANGAAGAGKMSQAEREAALREAVRFGVDVEHLRYNLTLTPEERLRRLQAFLRSRQSLLNARRLPIGTGV